MSINTIRSVISQIENTKYLDEDNMFSSTFIKIYDVLGLSEKEMADKCNVSVYTIHNWLNGKGIPTKSMRIPFYNLAIQELENMANKLPRNKVCGDCLDWFAHSCNKCKMKVDGFCKDGEARKISYTCDRWR